MACMTNRWFDEHKLIVREISDVGKLENGIRKHGPDMVMYEHLTRLGLGVINEYYFVDDLKTHTSRSSGSPVVTFAIVDIQYIGK